MKRAGASSLSLPGINIQAPWAELILSGEKQIETRTYCLPKKYIGKPLAIIETPGSNANFKARIIGIAVFGESIQYDSRNSFIKDFDLHLVESTHLLFGWKATKEKWGWPVTVAYKLDEHSNPPRPRGIVFCNECVIPIKLLSTAALKDFLT